ncbi:unnamed protein product [Durusdinium trenchii]|uniref:Uncharacterized protein n=1 Tax=Durusdinium trenchii TaxID=1381693 RepID=A0ABP0HTQ5_9DINO
MWVSHVKRCHKAAASQGLWARLRDVFFLRSNRSGSFQGGSESKSQPEPFSPSVRFTDPTCTCAPQRSKIDLPVMQGEDASNTKNRARRAIGSLAAPMILGWSEGAVGNFLQSL